MKQTKRIEIHRSRITSQTMTMFAKRSAQSIIDGTEKPKIPLKFAKHTARYNEFRYRSIRCDDTPGGLCRKRRPW